MASKIVTDFIKMQLFKKGGAIASDRAVQFSTNALEKRLINLGVDPRTINNQTELKQILAYVKQLEDQQFNQLYSTVLSGDDAANFLNKAFPKKGEVFDLQGNKLNPKKPIVGGTQGIEDLLKSGDLTKGTVSKKSEKVLEREMFEEANKKFNKQDIVADSVARITSMEPVAAMKEANKIIKREGIYKNLNKDQSQAILKSTDDWINQRDPADRYDYKNNRPFRDDPNFDPDDPSYDPDDGLDYATGGRAGFAEGLHAEKKPKINLRKLYERSLIHNDQPTTIDRSILRDLLEVLDGGSGIFPGYNIKNDLPKEMEAAQGGRAGHYTGGMVDVEPNLSDIGHGSDALMARTRLVSPNSQATTSTGLNYLLAEDNDNIRVPFQDGLKVYPKIMASKSNIGLGDGKNVDLQDLTYGGTVMYDKGPFSGGIEYLKGKEKFDFKDKDLTLNKDTTDRELANLILMMKLKNGSIKFKGNKDDQMINFSKSFADGGRIGFSSGGMGRRAFLKLMAALTGGVAAAKSGILGLSEGAGKKAVTETVKKSAGFNEVPPYFFKLVDKIRTMGDQTLASKDKAIAKKYKDYVMEEDFAGNIEIIKKNMDEMYPEEVYIKYTADDIATPNEKGFVKAAEYEEFTARPDMEGKMKDVEMGVPDEVVNEGSVFEDNMTEFGITKKADGGRIGFSAGKNLAKYLADKTITGSSQRFLEKVFGKQGLKEIIENDPDMHRGLLEVVEMFRAKDKQGLKTYMQKFLPHMDDETVEDFIIGSTESTEGIAGQLTRLGSGRDYKGKMEMMKQLEDVESLNKLDVTDRKPNASGGIATILGE